MKSRRPAVAATMTEILRYAAFTTDPSGGNPAGVVLDASGLSEADMQRIAADVGYSETAFVTETGLPGTYDVRYFAPASEVPFCGHATIATAVALGERGAPAEIMMRTRAGEIRVRTSAEGERPTATLTSVPPYVEDVPADLLGACLEALGWDSDDLDPTLPPRIAYAGARHLVLAAVTRARLAELDYDFERLRSLMADAGLTTLQLAWREDARTHHVRDPFPVGGVVEDPATGAAAAAYGAYLRAVGAITPPTTLTLHQGHDMGRPSLLTVDVPEGDTTPVSVTGSAVPIPA